MTYDDTDTVVLHRFFQTHADVVGKTLLGTSPQLSVEGDASAISGKRRWEITCDTLVSMGQASDIPHLSTLPSSQHQEYLDLMNHYTYRNVAAVKDIFVETFTERVRLLFISMCRIMPMYHHRRNRPFLSSSYPR